MPKKKKPKPKVSTIQPVRADIDPQLCKVYNPDKFKWNKTWIAEPKFDGLRCIVAVEGWEEKKTVRAYSRNGKPLWHLDHVLNEIREKTGEESQLFFDGEVYSTDWNQSMSVVKRSVSDHPNPTSIYYHVWDCLESIEWKLKKSNVSNADRKQRLALVSGGTYVEVVQGVEVKSHDEFWTVYQSFLEQGYEGAILKDPEGPYELGRRSPYWLKQKPWTDADLTVIGAYAGEGKHVGRIGGLVLEGEAEWKGRTYGIRTKVGTGFTDAEREYFQHLWDSKSLEGKIVEVTFQDITEDGAMRFPVYHRLREDKEK